MNQICLQEVTLTVNRPVWVMLALTHLLGSIKYTQQILSRRKNSEILLRTRDTAQISHGYTVDELYARLLIRNIS